MGGKSVDIQALHILKGLTKNRRSKVYLHQSSLWCTIYIAVTLCKKMYFLKVLCESMIINTTTPNHYDSPEWVLWDCSVADQRL